MPICTECGRDFCTCDPDEEICPKCQIADLPEAHMTFEPTAVDLDAEARQRFQAGLDFLEHLRASQE